MRGLVAEGSLRIAEAAIERTLRLEGPHAADHQRFDGHDRCPPLRHDPDVMQLLNTSSIIPYAEQLAGPGAFEDEFCAQVATRYPEPDAKRSLAGHIDGTFDGLEGPGDANTLLVCVLLSPHRSDRCGGTAIWNGSHRVLAAKAASVAGPIPGGTIARWGAQSTGKIEHAQGDRGDVFFGVWPLFHSATPVRTETVRRAVFFRLNHPDRSSDRYCRDPFADLPLLRSRMRGWR